MYEGVIASKIAAAAVDLARRRPGEIQRNLEMSQARNVFDWDVQQHVAIDKSKFCRYLETVPGENKGEEPCSMCGTWCAVQRWQKNTSHEAERV